MSANTITKKDAERRAWIKYQLELRGHSFASIARDLGLDRCTVRSAVLKRYPKMEKAIADYLGTTPEEIWPERYLARPKHSRKKAVNQ